MESTVSESTNSVGEGRPPAPSPLTGCYLLIVVGEPHSQEHKDIILQRMAKGFLSWDKDMCHIDLEKELQTLTAQAPEGEEARYGERLIQYASENLVTEVLIHPSSSTLIQCIRNLLSSFTRHRHIIHAGYTFAGNGSWILQDGTFSYADFCDAFQEHEVQRVIRAYENTVTIDIHCASEGEWTKLPNQQFTKYCQVRVNPNDVLTAGSPSIMNFIGYISPFLVPSEIDNILESSDVVGNIRFSHPTLYVFPGGQGDAALFGINGFNMLVDGGFARKACFWDFVRHLDRLDAVLLTRINNSNICGISSVLQRKRNAQVYPQIGHFFCNIQDKKSLLSPDGDKDKDPLLVNLINEGHEIVSNLRLLNLRPQSCYRDAEPINLYHKVGHGTLDMYVLSPAKDSKEVREFIQKWYSNDQNLFSNRKDAKDSAFPLQNLVSICALLVWQPANPSDTITRILFPGSTPQHKIFEGLDKLKHLEFLKYPVCSTKTLTPSDSIASISKAKQAKTNGLLDKIIGTDLQKEKSPPPLENKQKSENKLNMENKQRIISDNKRATAKQMQAKTRTIKDDVKKSESIESDRDDSLGDNIKMNGTDSENETNKMKTKGEDEKSDDKTKYKPKVEHKSKIDTKFSTTRGRTDSKYTKSTDRKSTRNILDKKSDVKSSPTTPKKSVEPKVNGVVKEKEQIKMKSNKLTSKPSPTATPAKSAKEANNRKVLESKNKVMAKRDVSKPPEKKDVTKSERKPISRRPKGTSPARKPSSPAKSTKPVPRSEKDSVIRKLKLEKEVATDSSTVSTPSADQEVKKLTEEELEAIKAQELADLKEEQEAVKEIEAVFSKDEKRSTVDSESREIVDETLITESEENEEYIIIEKEEVDQFTEDSINEQESAPKEDEIQKHLRDSEESEKQRRGSDDSKEANIEIEIKEPETEAEPEPETKEEPVEEPEVEPEAEPEEEEVKISKEKSKSPEEVKLIEDESCKVIEIITPECKTQLQQEVQEIIESATDIVKSKEPADVTPLEETKEKTEEMSKEISITSPEDKIELSSEKKQSDGKDVDEGEQKDGQEANYIQESQPDEKFSATVESGQTTTAPTLPEDERITLPDDERIQLDEIKEDQIDQVIEEKHVKEETKERDFQVTIEPTNFEPKPPMATIGGMQFESHQAHQAHLRDIVKTPDEVADLPVHEEADGGIYDEFAAVKKSTPSSEMQDKKHDSTDKLNETDVMKTSISDLQDDRIASTIESSDDKLLDKSDTKDELDSLEKDDDVKEHVKEAKIIDDDTKPSDQIETKDVEAEQKPADVVEEKDEKGEKEPTEKVKTEDVEVEHKPSEITEEKDVQKDQEPAEKVEETKKEKTPEIVEDEIIEKVKPDETTAITKDEKEEEKPTEIIKTEESLTDEKVSPQILDKEVPADEKPSTVDEQEVKPETDLKKEEKIEEKDKVHATPEVVDSQKLEKEQPEEKIEIEEISKDEKSPEIVVDKPEEKEEVSKEKIDDKDIPKDQKGPETTDDIHLQKEPQVEEKVEVKEVSKVQASEPVHDKDVEEEPQVEETIEKKEILKVEQVSKPVDEEDLDKEPHVEEKVEAKEKTPETVDDEGLEKKEVEEITETKDLRTDRKSPEVVDDKDVQKEEKVEEKIESADLSKDRKTPEIVDDKKLEEEHIEEKDQDKDLPEDQKTVEPIKDIDLAEEKTEEKVEIETTSKDEETPAVVEAKDSEKEQTVSKDLPEDQQISTAPGDESVEKDQDVEEKIEAKDVLKDQKTPEVDDEKLEKEKQVDEKVESKELSKDELTPEKDSIEEDSLDKDKHDKEVEKEPTVETKEIDTKQQDVSIKEPVKDEVPSSDVEVTEDHGIESAKAEEEKHVKTKVKKEEDNQLELRKSEEKDTVDVKDVSKAVVEEVPCVISEREGMQIELKESYIGKQSDTPTETKTIDDGHISDAKAKSEELETDETDKKTPKDEKPERDSSKEASPKLPTDLGIEESLVVQTLQKPAHPELVTVTPDSAPESPMFVKTIEDKIPTEQSEEQPPKETCDTKEPIEEFVVKKDVEKIVASVAHVLKSDAPLSEFDFVPYELKGYTTELRETHITTVESPIREDTPKLAHVSLPLESIPDKKDTVLEISPRASSLSFITEERRMASLHLDDKIEEEDEDVAEKPQEKKVSSLIEDSKALMQKTSQMISEIKLGKESKVEPDISTVKEVEEPIIEEHLTKPEESEFITVDSAKDKLSELKESVSSVMDLDSKIAHMVETQIESSLHTETQVPSTQEISSSSQDQITIDAKPDAKDIPDTTKDDATDAVAEEDVVEEKITPVQTSTLTAEKPEVCEKPETVDTVAETSKQYIEEEPTDEKITPVTKERSESPKEPSVEISQKEKDKTVDVTEKDVCVSKSTEEICEKTSADELSSKVIEEIEPLIVKQVEITKLELVPKQEETTSSEDTDDKIPHADIGETKQASEEDISTVSALDKTEKSPEEESSTDDSQKKQDDSVITQQSEVCVSTSASETSELPTKDETEMSKEGIKEPEATKLPADKITTSVEVHDVVIAPEDATKLEVTDTKETEVIDKEPEEVTKSEKVSEKPGSPIKDSNEIPMELCTDEHVTSHASELSEKSPTEKFLTEISEKEQDKLLTAKQTDSKQEDEKPSKVQDEPISNEVSVSPDTHESTSAKEQVISDKDDKDKEPVEEEILVPKKASKVETDASTKSSPEDASPEKKDDDVKEQLEEVKEDTITKTTVHETQIIRETAYECTDVLDKDIVSDIVETVSPDSKSLVEETEKIPPTEISSLSGNEPLTSDLIEDSLTEITKSDLSEKSDVKEDSPEKQLSEHSDSKDTRSDLDETSKDTAILSKDEEHDAQKEIPEKRDSTTSQSEEIVSKLLETQSDKSGKSTPDIKESVSSTHDLEIPSKDTSRKTTPEKELSNVESNVSIKSGTASPDIKFDESEKSGEISSAEKDEKDIDTKSDILSEGDNKDKSEVAEPKEEQPSVKDSSLEKTDDEKRDSDKSKEPSIERESPAKSDIVSETSDKLESIPPRTPDRMSVEKEIHTLVSDLKADVSGKSTPELKPDDIHDKAKSDESRKSTPDITKEESSILDSIKSDMSGKSTPDMKKDESVLDSIKSDVSEKSSIVTRAESIEDIPVSATKAKSEEKDEISIEKDVKKDDRAVEDAIDDKLPVEEAAESDSDEVADILSSEIERKSSAHSDIDDKQKTKESTPDSVAEKEDTDGEHVKHAEKLPNISIDSPVKGAEASPTHIYELTTAKYATGAPEILSKKTDLDTKLSLDIDNLSPQQISGRSTPEIKIDLAVDIKQDDSSDEEVIPETPTKIVDSKTDMHETEKTDEKPDTPEKELEKDTDLVTPGPSSVPDVPDSDHSKDSTKISTENLSGKSTPDIADVEKIKEMHDISKYEKHIPGKSTPPTAPVSPLMKEKDVFSLEEMRKSESPAQRISPDIDDATQRKSSKDLGEHAEIEDSAPSKESVQDSLSGVSTPDVKSLSPIHVSSENITKSATSSIEKISHVESHSPELSSSSNIELHQTSETTEIRDVTTETTVKEVESERKIETSKTTTIESTEKVTEKADEHSTISIETSTKIISEKESSDISETKSSTTTSVFTESLKSEQTKALEDKSTSVTKDIIEDTMSSVVTEKVETVITKDPVTDVTTTITSIKTTEVRSSTPGSDDYEVSSPPSDISSGQMSRVPNVWGVGSSEERQVYSDEDDMPGSPTSITSQVTHSPTTQFGYDDEKSTFDLTRTEGTILEKKVITGPHAHKHDTMSTSFYGALPADTDESLGSAVKTQSAPIPISGKSGRFSSDVSETSGEFQHHAKTESRFLDDADLDFDKAMSEHRQARGADLMKTSTVEITTSKSDGATTKVIKTETEQIHRNGYDKEAEDIEVKEKDEKEAVTKMAKEKVEKIVQESSSSQSSAATETKKDPIESWGKPLGLPSPAPPSLESNKTTPKKERKNVTSILAAKNRLNDDKRRSDSPGKYDKKFNKKPLPIYMDLTYVPHHGNSNYSYVDFFKRIRARYYVFSGTEPSKEVYNALLEAKQTWEDKELEVTIIPTYDTDVLGYWVAENEELLAKNKIDLSPSASRCTINLQDHETSCSAYRLEF